MVLQVCIRTLVFSLLHASLLSSLFSFSCTSPRVLVRAYSYVLPRHSTFHFWSRAANQENIGETTPTSTCLLW